MNVKIKKPVLIIGIGNLLLGDEGIGVHVAYALQKQKLPDFVEVIDGGTSGADLLDLLCGRDKVIFIDAVDADIEPGTIIKMAPDDLAAKTESSLSMHDIGILETLSMTKRLDDAPKEVVIIGVKPKDISPKIGLTNILASAMPKIMFTAIQEIYTGSEKIHTPSDSFLSPER
jgi:hydrogenase maturation protease